MPTLRSPRGKTVGKEKQISLGRVIDLKKNIFRNRKYGLYSYDPITEKITPISEDEKKTNAKNFSCVDFGGSYFLSMLMKKLKIDSKIDSMEGIDHESLKALSCPILSAVLRTPRQRNGSKETSHQACIQMRRWVPRG